MKKIIKIDALKPLLSEGWVAMHENGVWSWFEHEPTCMVDNGEWDDMEGLEILGYSLEAFNIEEAKDWTKSCQRVGD